MAKEKDKKRKPDYDDVPKVLKGPVKADPVKDVPSGHPLQMRPDYGKGQVGPQEAAMVKEIPMGESVGIGTASPSQKLDIRPATKPDYDSAPACGCMGQGTPGPVSEEVSMPGEGGQGLITILVCPDCGTEGPFNMTPPPGIPMEARTLRCASCKAKIPFKGIVKTASGKYMVAGTDSIEALVDRIRSIVKQGVIVTWDLAADVNTTLDRICKIQKSSKGKKDKD